MPQVQIATNVVMLAILYTLYVLFYLMCYCGYYYTVLLLHIIQDKMTPVYVAASHGQVGALKVLISAGANFNTANMVSKNMSVLFVLYCIWNSNQGQNTEIDK